MLEQYKTELESAKKEVELLSSLAKSEKKLRKDREDEFTLKVVTSTDTWYRGFPEKQTQTWVQWWYR